jgi:ribosome maturation factor RimP
MRSLERIGSGSPRTRSFLLSGVPHRFLKTNKAARSMMPDKAPELPPLTGHPVEASLEEPRIMREEGVDARVAAIIEPALIQLGYRLVRVRLLGQNGLTLQIFAERVDGTMSVDDCELVSRSLSPLLDLDDPIGKAYHLEVSSPGIDRPLVRKSDFDRWAGFETKLELSVPLLGRKRYRGWILGTRGEEAGMRLLSAIDQDLQEIWFPLNTVEEARLVLNDALIRESLKAGGH